MSSADAVAWRMKDFILLPKKNNKKKTKKQTVSTAESRTQPSE